MDWSDDEVMIGGQHPATARPTDHQPTDQHVSGSINGSIDGSANQWVNQSEVTIKIRDQ